MITNTVNHDCMFYQLKDSYNKQSVYLQENMHGKFISSVCNVFSDGAQACSNTLFFII